MRSDFDSIIRPRSIPAGVDWEPLQWWEDIPIPKPEKRLPAFERQRRRGIWEEKHSTIGALSCAEAWPPIKVG